MKLPKYSNSLKLVPENLFFEATIWAFYNNGGLSIFGHNVKSRTSNYSMFKFDKVVQTLTEKIISNN